MISSFINIIKDDTGLKALLGNPIRIYPFGTKLGNSPTVPYGLYTLITANPLNVLHGKASVDSSTVQVNLYAESYDSLDKIYEALRKALEPYAYIGSYRTADNDENTGLYGIIVEVELHEDRWKED